MRPRLCCRSIFPATTTKRLYAALEAHAQGHLPTLKTVKREHLVVVTRAHFALVEPRCARIQHRHSVPIVAFPSHLRQLLHPRPQLSFLSPAPRPYLRPAPLPRRRTAPALFASSFSHPPNSIRCSHRQHAGPRPHPHSTSRLQYPRPRRIHSPALDAPLILCSATARPFLDSKSAQRLADPLVDA